MAQTNMQTGTIAGYFENKEDAGQAIQALQQAGFTSAHLGVAHRGDFEGTSTSTTTSRAASATGEKAGGAWDKIKNFFEGNSAEPYAGEQAQGELGTREMTATPGIPTNERNFNDNDYDNSDLHGSLSGMSVPEDRSRYFGHRFNNSEQGAVVTVNAGDRGPEAESILTRYGADLGDNASSYDYSQTNTGTGKVQDAQNIQLLGEVLRVHKDRVSRGEVTIRKEVITENQTIQVPVTREELVIERRQADGTTPASGSIGQNSEMRIPLTEERASVDKSTVVREEVAVGKKRIEEVRDLSDKVRHEELVVEDTAGTRRS